MLDSRPCLMAIHMSPVTTSLLFYSTSSPLLPFLTHVFSLSPTVLSPSHAAHLHFYRPPTTPHNPLPYPHTSLLGHVHLPLRDTLDIFIPLLCIQLVPCAKIYSIIDQPQSFRIQRNHMCHPLYVSYSNYMHSVPIFLLLYSYQSFLSPWSH